MPRFISYAYLKNVHWWLIFLATIIVQLFSTYCLKAQSPSVNSTFIDGIGIQLGVGSSSLLGLDYTYDVILIKVPLRHDLSNKKSVAFDFIITPQSNFVYTIQDSISRTSAFELGVTLGIEVNKKIAKDAMQIGLGVAIGPMYLSRAPLRQSSGFIFSDELYLSLSFAITQRDHLGFDLGFRHQSNANLKQPNGGINSLYGTIGFDRCF